LILSILCGAFVVWVLVNLFRVRRVTREFVSGRVSILIPARHEEVTLPACLLSAVFTSAAEILVYNDSSTDGTANVVSSSMARYDRIRLMEGGPLPEGWVGKAFACQQLAEAANSEWLLFLDAGARISSQGLERLLAEAEQRKLTWVSCRAEVERPTFAQLVVLPALDFIGLGLAPGLLAGGSCTLVHKATYELLGGHQAFASEVGADFALAREWGRRGEKAAHFDGLGGTKVRAQ
jgi:glycosyltransferase involved in cell wall biosynthesis